MELVTSSEKANANPHKENRSLDEHKNGIRFIICYGPVTQYIG